MTSGFRFISFRKSIFVTLSLLILGSYAIHEANGYRGGVISYSKSGCNSCHGPKNSSTVVRLSTAATQIVAGQTYVFQFSVANPSDNGAGCDITADNGAKLAVSGTGLQVYLNELTHTSPRSFTGDSAVWTFEYTAPKKAGTAHIYAAGNAVNLDGRADNGDISNVTVYNVTVIAPAGPSITAPALVRDTALRGDTVSTSFWVKNSGNATLTIDHYSLLRGTAYSILDSGVHTLAAGDSTPVTVQFFPGSAKTYTDSVRIYSNDELTPVSSTALVGLSTTGQFKISSNLVNFGPVGINGSDTMNVTITNMGTGLLSVTPQSPTYSTSFTIASEPANPPFNIAPKGTLVIRLAYTPTSSGNDTAHFPITVSTYKGSIPFDTSIVLIGVGTAAVVDPALVVNSSVLIYPNPSSGEFNLSSSGMSGTADVDVSDAAGRIVAHEEITLGSESAINLSGLSNGTYFLALKPRDGQSVVRRIVVQR